MTVHIGMNRDEVADLKALLAEHDDLDELNLFRENDGSLGAQWIVEKVVRA